MNIINYDKNPNINRITDKRTMIEFKNVTQTYNETDTKGADKLSFKIQKGEFVFITGPTGAGKTTLVKLILKEEVPDRGVIFVNGTNVLRLKGRVLPLYRRNIGIVFQNGRLIPYKTVAENIEFALYAVGNSKADVKNMVPQILKLTGMSHKADSYPNQLSGGETQKAAMARAMANNSPILIADEPTGNLDPKSSLEIMNLFQRFNKLGTTVMIITHDESIVKKMNKRVIRIENGRVVSDKYPSRISFEEVK